MQLQVRIPASTAVHPPSSPRGGDATAGGREGRGFQKQPGSVRLSVELCVWAGTPSLMNWQELVRGAGPEADPVPPVLLPRLRCGGGRSSGDRPVAYGAEGARAPTTASGRSTDCPEHFAQRDLCIPPTPRPRPVASPQPLKVTPTVMSPSSAAQERPRPL